MERSANRGEVVRETTAGFGKVAVAFAAMGILLIGCGAGPVSWNECSDVNASLTSAMPVVELPALSAADAKTRAPSGGLVVAFGSVAFGGFSTRACSYDPTATAPGLGYTDPNTNVFYNTLFEDGIMISAGWIMSGPATSAAALGDTYITLSFEYQSFAGKSGIGSGLTAGTLDITGLFADVKTMLNNPGSRSYFKPYVRYGVGITSNSAVSVGTNNLYSQSIQPAIRASVGVDFRILGLKFFADAGPQIINAPLQDNSDPLGDADSMMTVPLRIGLSLTF